MKFPILVLCLILSGCSMFTKEEPVVVKVPKSEIFHPPAPARLNLLQPDKWEVLPKGTPTPETVYALTPKGYEILSLNLAELKRYISDLQSLLRYYRELKTVEPLPEEPTQ